MSETIKAQREQLAHVALGNKDILEGLIERMNSSSRRTRQNTASTLSFVAAAQPEAMLPYLDVVVDALERPEAQTRWESLDILTALVPFDADRCETALPGAEGALFDEDSGPLHLAAVRFLCRIGSTSQERSVKVWPLIDEAIQCYHGDLEFGDMLVAVTEYSQGKLSDSVKASLAQRMAFDASNSKGSLQRRARQILENVGGAPA